MRDLGYFKIQKLIIHINSDELIFKKSKIDESTIQVLFV